MHTASLETFRDLGITLDSRLTSKPLDTNYTAPTPLLRAVQAAARARQQSPGVILASPNRHTNFQPNSSDPAFNMLASLVLKDYEPPIITGEYLNTINDLSQERKTGTCSMAEVHFSRLFAIMRKEEGYKLPQRLTKCNPNYQIIVSADTSEQPGLPLLLRKASGDASAITLRRVIIDDVDVPAGGMVAIRMQGEDANGSPSNWIRELGKIEVINTEQIDAITPLRLTPWAYSETERQYFATKVSGAQESYYDLDPPLEHQQLFHAKIGDIALIAAEQVQVYG